MLRRLILKVVIFYIILTIPPVTLYADGDESYSPPPKNVILFIGDGMGFEHVKAAGIYLDGSDGTLPFESFPYNAEVTTYSANSSLTDSAAAATAIATGFKVYNGVLSTAVPGHPEMGIPEGAELLTVLEYYRDRDKMTGLVTTTYMTHATPAAFGAHDSNRGYLATIAADYLNQTRPNLLLGGGANGLSPSLAANAGYLVVRDSSELRALDTDNASLVSGQFGTTHLPYEYDYHIGINQNYAFLPHLSEMAEVALDILDNDPDGFFMMVEGGKIDLASHLPPNAMHIERTVFEMVEFSNTVQKVIDWAYGRTDTLLIVTADHETGGLKVLVNNGQGNFPTVSWSTSGHTSKNVPAYAWGSAAQQVRGVLDNTDLFDIMTGDYLIITHANPPGRGVITKSPEDLYYIEGTVLTLTATPNDPRKWKFSHWSGQIGDNDPESPAITITMDSHKTVNAHFKSIKTRGNENSLRPL